jgi:hypothetical protein
MVAMIFVTALDHPQLFIRYFMTRVAVSMLGWKKLGLEQRLGGRIVTYAGDLDAETGHAASARRTRFAISGPRSRSIIPRRAATMEAEPSSRVSAIGDRSGIQSK